MSKITPDVQQTINSLQANWVWVPDWVDSSLHNTAARLVSFTRSFNLSSIPSEAIVHFSADTRYKLFVNGQRVAVGPTRSHPTIWYYDTLDIAPYLQKGENKVEFLVIRYFASSRGGMPFERTTFPGLTVFGSAGEVDLSSKEGWEAVVDESRLYPTGLIDDVFLHINERVKPTPANKAVTPKPYAFKTLNGELAPWRLRPRSIPMPESTHVNVNTVRAINSASSSSDDWSSCLSGKDQLALPGGSSHSLDIQADVHSTAFVRWTFKATETTQIKLKLMYSEGYELEPRQYPFFRTKADRTDPTNGHIIGPFDEVILDIPAGKAVIYEPFWFRTFRLIRLNLDVLGSAPVELVGFNATQVNYPLDVKGSWKERGDEYSERIWDVSIRTMRNCMFDGYSDCPFYEQLQYSGDSRSVGLFHYLLSGDDQLMRQAITNFAASITPEGLTQSRFPSHVPQIIAGFSLYWILQICDHHLFFGDTTYTKSFVPKIDGVFEYFDSHIDVLGLVSGISEDVWQYCDWVTTWGATDTHPDKGVPTSGRKNNRHTYISMLYAYVLQQAAQLLRQVGRPGNADEYETRASSLRAAIKKHCYDGSFFTDSTADVADDLSYSQHCQVFAVLAGIPSPKETPRLLTQSFDQSSTAGKDFSKCSYVMMFYALRAFAQAGDSVYEEYYSKAWNPWKKMLDNNLTTWEEDDVRQRSDCHAWGSVPIYEFCTEVAGVKPLAAGCKKLLFKPRLALSQNVEVKVALGQDNLATVAWKSEGSQGKKTVKVSFKLEKKAQVISQLPGKEPVDHGEIDQLEFEHQL
ncbi:alpha-L-rhamnosidase [Kwoniella heveanensis CBS 569]|nr:alpha-L-rhamnosidase [Kwoniella heveanensis CBS 569]